MPKDKILHLIFKSLVLSNTSTINVFIISGQYRYNNINQKSIVYSRLYLPYLYGLSINKMVSRFSLFWLCVMRPQNSMSCSLLTVTYILSMESAEEGSQVLWICLHVMKTLIIRKELFSGKFDLKDKEKKYCRFPELSLL